MSKAGPRKPALPAAPAEAAEAPYQGPYARTFDQRRQQILSTAWDMIAEHGNDQFNLAELSKRSGVALRTIYNAFDDKEGVIAQAVATHHNALFEGIQLGKNESHTLAESVEMAGRVANETARVPAFAATASRMYFASRANLKLIDTLRQLPIYILRAWFRSDEADMALVRQCGVRGIEHGFANVQWGVVNDWAAGRLDERGMNHAMKSNMIWIGLAFGNRAGRGSAKRLGASLG